MGVEEEKLVFAYLCGQKVYVCIYSIFEVKSKSILLYTHTDTAQVSLQKRSNTFGISLEHHQWLSGNT